MHANTKIKIAMVVVLFLVGGVCLFDAFRPAPSKEGLKVVKGVPTDWTLKTVKERPDADPERELIIKMGEDEYSYLGEQPSFTNVHRELDKAIDDSVEIELLVDTDWTRLPGSTRVWQVAIAGNVEASYEHNLEQGGKSSFSTIGGITVLVFAVIMLFVKMPESDKE